MSGRMNDRSVFEEVFDCASVVIGASAVVVGDDSGAALAVPGVPSPREVTDLVSVVGVLTLAQEPLRQGVHKAALAVVLTELTHDQRDLLRDWEQLAFPARGVGAVVEVVDVCRSRQLIQRIVDSVVEPLGEVVRVRESADHYHVLGACASHCVYKCLVPGHIETYTWAATSIFEASPSVISGSAIRVRLIEKVEDDIGHVFEMAGRLTPEGNRVISVRHWLLSVGELRARSSPVQVKNNVHSMIIDPLNKVSDGIDIVLATILRLYPVDTEPALLIQRNSDCIGIPILNVLNHVVVIGSVKYSVPINALKLSPRVREALQDNFFSSRVIYKSVALHVNSRYNRSDQTANCQD